MSSWLEIDKRDGKFALYSCNNDGACCGENRTESTFLQYLGLEQAWQMYQAGAIRDSTKWRSDGLEKTYFNMFPDRLAIYRKKQLVKDLPLFEHCYD